LAVAVVSLKARNDDELSGDLEWIDDDFGIRPPPPPYPTDDVAVISSKLLEGLPGFCCYAAILTEAKMYRNTNFGTNVSHGKCSWCAIF